MTLTPDQRARAALNLAFDHPGDGSVFDAALREVVKEIKAAENAAFERAAKEVGCLEYGRATVLLLRSLKHPEP